MSRLPGGPLVAYYGDDFTGSTDVMEVLTFAGLPTVLFLDVPAPEDLARFPGRRGIGVAGTARSRSPAWMRTHLPPALAALDALGAPVLQYKVCSTFDSSPTTGSIGCALDLGLAATRRDWCAMVVGAPALRRYQAFGNLFAAVDGVGYRLDRHPTMSRHPVTPMAEADLRRHLAAQTGAAIGLVDLVALKQERGAAALAAARESGQRAVLFDVIDNETLEAAGRVI
nr:four-carbon acid sugar kinase family protein [Rhodospirillales bacterium]